jgi:hypothetical protein
MSNGSSTQARIYRETTWAETPSTSNKMTDINITSESLTQSTNTEQSKNIRADGNISNVNRVGISASGDIGVEMNFGSGLDLLFEGSLRNLFATPFTVTGTGIAAVASGNKFTDSGNGFTNVVVGQFIKASGFVASSGANNGYYRVIAKASAGEITVEGKALINETAGTSRTLKGTLLKNGVTDQSFLLEIERNDIATFKYFTGMRVGQCQFGFTPNSLVNGSFGLRGKEMKVATTTQGDGSPNAAAVTRSMNSVDNVKAVFKGSALSTLDITNFSFTISPQLRDQPAINNLAMVGIGSGTQTAEITLEGYLEDNVFLQEYLNFTQTSLALVAEDAAGNAYVFDFPTVVPSNGDNSTSGINTDVLQKFTYMASINTALGATIGITKI